MQGRSDGPCITKRAIMLLQPHRSLQLVRGRAHVQRPTIPSLQQQGKPCSLACMQPAPHQPSHRRILKHSRPTSICQGLLAGTDVVSDYTRALTEEVRWSAAVGWQSQAAMRFGTMQMVLCIRRVCQECCLRHSILPFSQIHDLAEELKDFRPEKADEVLSKEEQRQLTEYINRHVYVWKGTAAWCTMLGTAVHAHLRNQTQCKRSDGCLSTVILHFCLHHTKPSVLLFYQSTALMCLSCQAGQLSSIAYHCRLCCALQVYRPPPAGSGCRGPRICGMPQGLATEMVGLTGVCELVD